ncbi:hypothetical protein BESB_012820 [Besnoitia besnoiti]|uniref:RAP domain-containing protein n=1 Tax=Besnoitia besnoiti TaxID=94643 RepID=A0A2A9MBA7_BESBE|nr:hypothetical protein BESB_012820 [Besnoitia besnoiti]PFH32670.1 hypothetical protein BESB_012820 [Besnoitia besnoiti]
MFYSLPALPRCFSSSLLNPCTATHLSTHSVPFSPAASSLSPTSTPFECFSGVGDSAPSSRCRSLSLRSCASSQLQPGCRASPQSRFASGQLSRAGGGLRQLPSSLTCLLLLRPLDLRGVLSPVRGAKRRFFRAKQTPRELSSSSAPYGLAAVSASPSPFPPAPLLGSFFATFSSCSLPPPCAEGFWLPPPASSDTQAPSPASAVDLLRTPESAFLRLPPSSVLPCLAAACAGAPESQLWPEATCRKVEAYLFACLASCDSRRSPESRGTCALLSCESAPERSCCSASPPATPAVSPPPAPSSLASAAAAARLLPSAAVVAHFLVVYRRYILDARLLQALSRCVDGAFTSRFLRIVLNPRQSAGAPPPQASSSGPCDPELCAARQSISSAGEPGDLSSSSAGGSPAAVASCEVPVGEERDAVVSGDRTSGLQRPAAGCARLWLAERAACAYLMLSLQLHAEYPLAAKDAGSSAASWRLRAQDEHAARESASVSSPRDSMQRLQRILKVLNRDLRLIARIGGGLHWARATQGDAKKSAGVGEERRPQAARAAHVQNALKGRLPTLFPALAALRHEAAPVPVHLSLLLSLLLCRVPCDRLLASSSALPHAASSALSTNPPSSSACPSASPPSSSSLASEPVYSSPSASAGAVCDESSSGFVSRRKQTLIMEERERLSTGARGHLAEEKSLKAACTAEAVRLLDRSLGWSRLSVCAALAPAGLQQLQQVDVLLRHALASSFASSLSCVTPPSAEDNAETDASRVRVHTLLSPACRRLLEAVRPLSLPRTFAFRQHLRRFLRAAEEGRQANGRASGGDAEAWPAEASTPTPGAASPSAADAAKPRADARAGDGDEGASSLRSGSVTGGSRLLAAGVQSRGRANASGDAQLLRLLEEMDREADGSPRLGVKQLVVKALSASSSRLVPRVASACNILVPLTVAGTSVAVECVDASDVFVNAPEVSTLSTQLRHDLLSVLGYHVVFVSFLDLRTASRGTALRVSSGIESKSCEAVDYASRALLDSLRMRLAAAFVRGAVLEPDLLLRRSSWLPLLKHCAPHLLQEARAHAGLCGVALPEKDEALLATDLAAGIAVSLLIEEEDAQAERERVQEATDSVLLLQLNIIFDP